MRYQHDSTTSSALKIDQNSILFKMSVTKHLADILVFVWEFLLGYIASVREDLFGSKTYESVCTEDLNTVSCH